MTCEIFTKWLKEVNKKMKIEKRCILLVLDNAPSHPKIQLSNIQLSYLPPNMTSAAQPLDQGIIQSFKINYRKFLLQKLISEAESCTSVSDFTRRVTVLDAIRWSVCSWKSVRTETLVKCFHAAGFHQDSRKNIIRRRESY